jgi:hypothetical protein
MPFNITSTGGSGDGAPGPRGQQGLPGAAGADGEGFNFRGTWQTDTLYLKNDVVTQNGSSYIANYDYQDNDGPSLDGDLWAILAQKGADGDGSGTDNHGDFQFTAATANVDNSQTLRLESRRWDGTQASALTLNPGDPSASLSATDVQGESFSNQWSSATWSGETVDILNTPNVINFLNEITSYANVQRVIINEGAPMAVTGLSWTPENVQLGVAVPAGELTPITNITFIYAFTSQVRLDYDNNAIDISGNRMNINLTTTQGRDINIISADDATVRAVGDDLNLHAGDDIRFISSWDNADHSWTMDSEGRLQLPGNGYIQNPEDSSGDGYQNDTIKIVPDNLLNSDQYLIIDPTAPNHIHIRPGGTQDASTADIFIGGERNNLHISDMGRNVSISSRPAAAVNIYTNLNPTGDTSFVVSNTANIYVGDTAVYAPGGLTVTVDSVTTDSPEVGLQTITANLDGAPAVFVGGGEHIFTHEEFWDNGWEFRSDGVLSGPAMGGLKVLGLLNAGDNDLGLYANDADIILQTADGSVNIVAPEVNITSNASPSSLNINTYLGAVVNSNRTSTYAAEDKVVAVLGDIEAAAPTETSFTVNGGTLGTQPTFDGAPLFSGTYVKTGPIVHFQIQVQMDNITNFGTGQYYVDLPFPAKYSYHFRDACLHDNSGTVRQYAMSGHVYAGQSQVTLWFTSTNGQDELFDYNSPALLTVNDNFHIAGTYITS